MRLLLDLGWLFAVPAATLVVMSFSVGIDTGDFRTQAVLFAFLLPGWWIAPRLMRQTDGPAQRYALSAILSFGMHALLVFIGGRLGSGFDAYYVAYLLFIVAAAIARLCTIDFKPTCSIRIHPLQLLLLAAVLILVGLVWRTPFSNDISQFLPQQMDMCERRSLQASSIGMTAFGLEQPMPRWNAHTWHVWISLLADAARLPVEGIVYHWATVPVAVLALVTLGVCIRDLAGGRPPLWAIVLSILGPLTLWFRNYNAYVYAYRLTNNLCLDKDLALFWLIPAWLWIFFRAVRTGSPSMWSLLLLLSPLTVGLHPMTPTYLLLLSPFAVIISVRLDQRGLLRGLAGGTLILALFASTWFLGDAQTAHQEIERLVQLDAEQSLRTGRPQHYWGGHYAAVPELRLQNVTTEWAGEYVRLRRAVLTDCSVLLAMPFAIAGWIMLRCFVPGGGFLRRDWQPVVAVATAFATLVAVYAFSEVFLARAPYLFRGFERLHWFCYVPGLVTFAMFFTQLSRITAAMLGRWMTLPIARRYVAHVATILLTAHLAEQCWHIQQHSPTMFSRVRGLNSLWDHFAATEDPYFWMDELNRLWENQTGIVPVRPAYLSVDDRVLPLVPLAPSQFHLLRQAIWWPELYGEGHMLMLRGDSWLADWHAYYDAVDHIANPAVDAWIVKNRVTLVVDSRPGAAEGLRELGARINRQVDEVAPGIWRLTPLP